jgi:NDP-sugar pyrophosphorylase family protein
MYSSKNTAVILAGGKGTRLRPYTSVFPKPLVPVGGKPILEIIIKKLKINSFKRIIICLNKKNDLIKIYFGDGKKFGVKINYVYEKKALSTMGPLHLIKNLPKNFLIMNGDILAEINYKKFFQEHSKSKKKFSVAVKSISQKIDYGVLKLENKNVVKFLEKPKLHFNVSMGIYAANIDILKWIPKNKFYGFDNLMKNLIKNKQTINISKYKNNWLDIGRPLDYHKANKKYKYA